MPIGLLISKNLKAVTRITDGVRFFMCDSLMSPYKYFTMVC